MKLIAADYFGICLDHTKYRARRVNKSLGCYTFAAEAAWAYDKSFKDMKGKEGQRLNFLGGKKQFDAALAKEVAFRQGRGPWNKGGRSGGGAGKKEKEKEVDIAEARRLRAAQRDSKKLNSNGDGGANKRALDRSSKPVKKKR